MSEEGKRPQGPGSPVRESLTGISSLRPTSPLEQKSLTGISALRPQSTTSTGQAATTPAPNSGSAPPTQGSAGRSGC